MFPAEVGVQSAVVESPEVLRPVVSICDIPQIRAAWVPTPNLQARTPRLALTDLFFSYGSVYSAQRLVHFCRQVECAITRVNPRIHIGP